MTEHIALRQDDVFFFLYFTKQSGSEGWKRQKLMNYIISYKVLCHNLLTWIPLSSVGASLPGRREIMSPSTRRLTGKLINRPSRYVHCKDTAGREGTNRSSVSFSQSEGGCSKKSTERKYVISLQLIIILLLVLIVLRIYHTLLMGKLSL